MKNKNKVLFTASALFASALSIPSLSMAMPAGQDHMRIITSQPKKEGQQPFSLMVNLRESTKGSDHTGRANGLVFLNGPSHKQPTSAAEAARKIATAVNSALSYESPRDRAALVEYTKGEPEINITNKEGFDFIYTTYRDYTNQKVIFSVPGTTFSNAKVKISINLVYSAKVEYLPGTPGSLVTSASGGKITVQADNDKAIVIDTGGKTIVALEKELANALGSEGIFSKSSLYQNYVEKDSRNYKPFDQGETQLLSLNAQQISIDIDDPSLGVIAKFAFPDENKPADVANNAPIIAGIIIAGFLGFIAYNNYRKKEEEA